MDTTSRLQLIRARLNRPASGLPKPAGQHRAANPNAPAIKLKKPYVRGPESPSYAYGVYGEVTGKSPNRKEWVERADKKVTKTLRPRRMKRVSALTRISYQLPLKLPQIPQPSRTPSNVQRNLPPFGKL